MRSLGKFIGLLFGIVLLVSSAYAQNAGQAKPAALNLHIKAGPEPATAPEVANLAIERYSVGHGTPSGRSAQAAARPVHPVANR